jgi:hypothetical protein
MLLQYMRMPVNCKAERNIHACIKICIYNTCVFKSNFRPQFSWSFCIVNVGRRMDHIYCQMLSVFSCRHAIQVIAKIEWKYQTGKKLFWFLAEKMCYRKFTVLACQYYFLHVDIIHMHAKKISLEAYANFFAFICSYTMYWFALL